MSFVDEWIPWSSVYFCKKRRSLICTNSPKFFLLMYHIYVFTLGPRLILLFKAVHPSMPHQTLARGCLPVGMTSNASSMFGGSSCGTMYQEKGACRRPLPFCLDQQFPKWVQVPRVGCNPIFCGLQN